jgi:hypothetical protein
MLKHRTILSAPALLLALLFATPSTSGAFLHEWHQNPSVSEVQNLWNSFSLTFVDRWKGLGSGLPSAAPLDGSTEQEDDKTFEWRFGTSDFRTSFPWWTLLHEIGPIPSTNNVITPTAAVPIPGAVWLFGSGLLAMAGLYGKRSNRNKR